MNKERIKQLQDRWRETNAPLGKKLGYPQCCIDAFCAQPPQVLQASKPTEDDKLRYKVSILNGKATGFIPCIDHAKQIASGKITLQSLIKDRDPDFGIFPFFGMH